MLVLRGTGDKAFAAGAEVVISAECPSLEVRNDAMNAGWDDMGGHFVDEIGLKAATGNAGTCAPAVGLARGAQCDIGFDEGMQAGEGSIRDQSQMQAAGRAVDGLLDGGNNPHFALWAAAPAGHGIIFGAIRMLRLFGHAQKQGSHGVNPRTAQLGTQQLGALVVAEPELAPHLPRRHAVRMAGHRISRPHPHRERQLRVVHFGYRHRRDLTAVLGAFVDPCLGLELPGVVWLQPARRT